MGCPDHPLRGGDGLLPGGAPDIPAATASALADVAHADLPALPRPHHAGRAARRRPDPVHHGPVCAALAGRHDPDTRPQHARLARHRLRHVRPGRSDRPVARPAAAARRLPWRRPGGPGPGLRSPAHQGDQRRGGLRVERPARVARPGRGRRGPAGRDRRPGRRARPARRVGCGSSAGRSRSAADGRCTGAGPPLLPDDASGDGPDLAAARSVLSLLGELFDATHDPAADLTPPAGLPDLTVPAWSVRGSIDAATLTRAFGALVRAGLGAFQPGTGPPGNPGAPAPRRPPRCAPRSGSACRCPRPPRPATRRGYRSMSRRRWPSADLPSRPRAAAAAGRALDVGIYRANGWLAGGPQGVAPAPGVLRTPSLRRANISVAADLVPGQRGASATVTLADGTALGVARDAWVLGTGGETPGAEARVLLGRLAAALGRAGQRPGRCPRRPAHRTAPG